jgi:hypothetical protein
LKEGLVVFVMFLVTLLFAMVSLWLNIRLSKSKIGRWNSNSTVRFVMSVGNVGEKQVEMWQRTGGYSEAEANEIIKHQLLSMLGVFLGFLASAILGAFMTS